MKKFFSIVLIASTLVTSAFASDNGKANSKMTAHIKANYANAHDITWTYTDKFEKASLILGQEKVDVYYDEYGDLMGTTKTMAFDKLPKSALISLTTDYTFPDYTLTDCISVTDADNNTNYYVSFDLDGESVMVSISTNGAVSLL